MGFFVKSRRIEVFISNFTVYNYFLYFSNVFAIYQVCYNINHICVLRIALKILIEISIG